MNLLDCCSHEYAGSLSPFQISTHEQDQDLNALDSSTYVTGKVLIVKLHSLANATKTPNRWKGLGNPHITFLIVIFTEKHDQFLNLVSFSILVSQLTFRV
jgi:hypothetical protein